MISKPTGILKVPGGAMQGGVVDLSNPKTAIKEGGDLKHISQLDIVQRARADQATRDCLLAIVASQGKPISFPLAALNAISDECRLVIEVKEDCVVLTSERAIPDPKIDG